VKISYFHYLYGQDSALHHVQQFATAVRSLGYQISVHNMNLAPTDDATVKNHVRKAFKRRFSPYLHEFKELLWNPRYICREIEIVRKEQPDIILSRTHYLTASCLAVSKWTGTPLVLEVNAPARESALYLDEYLHIPLLGVFLERLMVHGAAHVVVVSEALRRYITDCYNVGTEKITVNHNGADCDRFHPGLDGAAVRRKFGLHGKRIVGFVGSLQTWHGPDLLEKMIKQLASDGVKFLLVGGGAGWKKFRDSIAKSGLSEHLIYTGRIPHASLPEHVAAMDVAVMPDSNFYGSPLKVLEYMSAAVPTVAPRYGPLEELIQHGREGLLFAPRDTDTAVQQIRFLLDHPQTCREMGLAASHRVAQGFTWRHNAERTISVCRRTLECPQFSARSHDPLSLEE